MKPTDHQRFVSDPEILSSTASFIPETLSTFRGPAGNDTFKGGLGADRFRLSQGTDHILDFKPHRGDTLQRPASATLQFIQNQQHLLLLDPNDNIHTTLQNTSLEPLLKAQPELLN